METEATASKREHTRVIEVKRADLPLSCPQTDETLWNMHPRVFLPIEKSGKATCPYCGAKYQLVESNLDRQRGMNPADDQRGELRFSPLETPSVLCPPQATGNPD